MPQMAMVSSMDIVTAIEMARSQVQPAAQIRCSGSEVLGHF